MLETFICVSGIYSASNIILLAKNIKSVKYNTIKTLNGIFELRKDRIFTDNNTHNIYWINDKTCMLYNIDRPFRTAMFDNNTDKFKTLCFNDVDECKNYCIEHKMKFDNVSYGKIKIETIDINKIWMVYNITNMQYTILPRTTEDEFKKFMIKKHQLPFRKINFILFLALLIFYAESNY